MVNLDAISYLENLRVVSSDGVVLNDGRYFQVLQKRKVQVPPSSKVRVA